MQTVLYCINTNCKQEIPLGTESCPHCGQDQRPPGHRAWTCTKCGLDNPESRTYCSACSWVRGKAYIPPPPTSTSVAPIPATLSNSPIRIELRYTTLRVLSGLFNVLAWILLIIGVLGPVIYLIITNSSGIGSYMTDITITIVGLIYGGLGLSLIHI